MNEFEKSIKAHLDQRASEYEEFAKKYANPEKSIEKCCNFICSEVKKTGRCGFADDEIYGIAIHYYDEDDIKAVNPVHCKVVVNHAIELSEEEKNEIRKKAIEEIHKKAVEDLQHKKAPVKKEDDGILKNQMSLFDEA